MDSPHQGLWVRVIRRNQQERLRISDQRTRRVWGPGNKGIVLEGKDSSATPDIADGSRKRRSKNWSLDLAT